MTTCCTFIYISCVALRVVLSAVSYESLHVILYIVSFPQYYSTVISVTEGDHGYNNSLPDMHPFFMAMGPALKVNHTVETFKNVDVYPLICKILGIEPAPNNGSMDIVQILLKPKKERKLYELDNTFVVCKYIHVPENCKLFISCV